MSKIIDDLRTKITAIGGTLDAGDYSLHLDAPAGYVWRANGMPSLSIHYATNSESWLTQAVRAERDNLHMGLQRETDEARLAEIRWDLGEDDWDAAPDAPARLEWPS